MTSQQKEAEVNTILQDLIPGLEVDRIGVASLETRPLRTTGQASLNDLLDRHADFLNGRLTEAAYAVARACRSRGFKALPLSATGCPADARFLEAIFSFKHAGQAAGLGYLGRSSLLITPDFGPRVRLSCCLTEARLEPTRAEVVDVCQRCQVCIKKCPAGAISMPQAREPYVINKFACGTFVDASGGCSECMRLCPAVDKLSKV
jgi:epoxyqueuosine reductase QueG